MAKKMKVTRGSGNVFADLGLPNPEQELLKAQLTLQIYRIVKARKLTQAQAGEVLGIKQPHVSALMRNRAGNFSVGRLMEFLTALGQDVRITVKPTRKRVGEMEVRFAIPLYGLRCRTLAAGQRLNSVRNFMASFEALTSIVVPKLGSSDSHGRLQ